MSDIQLMNKFLQSYLKKSDAKLVGSKHVVDPSKNEFSYFQETYKTPAGDLILKNYGDYTVVKKEVNGKERSFILHDFSGDEDNQFGVIAGADVGDVIYNGVEYQGAHYSFSSYLNANFDSYFDKLMTFMDSDKAVPSLVKEPDGISFSSSSDDDKYAGVLYKAAAWLQDKYPDKIEWLQNTFPWLFS